MQIGFYGAAGVTAFTGAGCARPLRVRAIGPPPWASSRGS